MTSERSTTIPEATNPTRTRIRSNDPSLKKLHLVYPPEEYFGEDDFEGFLNDLKNNTVIHYVLFERRFVRGISPSQYEQVLHAVALLTNLVEIEIWSVKVPLSTLCAAVKNAPKLSRIGLGMVTLTETTSCETLSSHPSLVHFCLSDFRFLVDEDDKNMDSLWEALSTCPKLLNVEVCSNQFAENPWTSAGLAKLACCGSVNFMTLRRLSLKGSDIEAFAQLIGQCPALNILNLRENKLGDDGCLSIARAVANSQIMELDLRDNQLSEEGTQSFLPTLLTPDCRLERLSLSWNPIRDVGARLLSEVLEDETRAPHLIHLDLARTQITDVGCNYLAKALAINKTLQSLGLSHNPMTNKAYIAFGSVLRHDNNTLESINLQCDRKQIDESGCEALLEMVEDNYTLTTVSTNLGSSYESKSYKFACSSRIRMFLRLNHAGRQKLLDQRGTKADWVQAIAAVQDNLFAIHYLILANPSLCQTE